MKPCPKTRKELYALPTYNQVTRRLITPKDRKERGFRSDLKWMDVISERGITPLLSKDQPLWFFIGGRKFNVVYHDGQWMKELDE